MSKIRKKLDTPENRAFWAAMDRIIAEVEEWPDWKKGSIRVGEPWTDSYKDISPSLIKDLTES